MIEGWKEQIKLSVGYDPGYWDIEEVHLELDRVYTQAAKADEYKAKAVAFDAILKSYEEASHEGQMVHEFSNIIEKYERGESK